jgi:hypothetical protein
MCTFGTLCGVGDPVKAISALEFSEGTEVTDLKNGATEISEETKETLFFFKNQPSSPFPPLAPLLRF